MATAHKLEMSLDEIIKANKTKQGGLNGRKAQMVGKRLARGNIAKKSFGRKPIRGRNPIKKKGVPSRVGINVRRGRPIRKVNRVGGGVRKNVALKNKAVISATKNLVNKLVKKALSKSNISAVNSLRGNKRLSANRMRAIILNKISPRSRVISRRRSRIIAVQPQQQPVIVQRVVRGRGPIRFASDAAAFPQTTKIVAKRRFVGNNLQQLSQPPPVVLVQQQSPKRVLPNFSSGNVRQHINALRRATTVQQLQSQFLNQQKPVRRQQFQAQQQGTTSVYQPIQSRPRFMQSPIIVQQRSPPRRLRQQPPQYVIVQQPSRGKFRGKPQQMFRRQQRQQQQVVFDPTYDPPNFLQRIPTSSGAAFIQY